MVEVSLPNSLAMMVTTMMTLRKEPLMGGGNGSQEDEEEDEEDPSSKFSFFIKIIYFNLTNLMTICYYF